MGNFRFRSQWEKKMEKGEKITCKRIAGPLAKDFWFFALLVASPLIHEEVTIFYLHVLSSSLP